MPDKSNKRIFFAVITLGVTAVSAQIVLLRQMLVSFSGNELTIGIILAFWLILGSIGSFLASSLSKNIQNKNKIFVRLQLLVSVWLFLSIPLTRLIKHFFGLNIGELVPLSVVALSCILILLPVCAAGSFLFSLACGMFKAEEKIKGISRVYVLETSGSLVGGLLTSFFLISFFNSTQVIAAVILLNLFSAYFLTFKKIKWQVFVILPLIVFGLLKPINEYSLRVQWHGYKVLAEKDSRYADITVVEKDSQYSFFANGLRLYTLPEEQEAEEAVNFNLLMQNSPERVLLIGGGAGGMLSEILKHPVKEIVYLELDPAIIELSEKYLPKPYTASFSDARVKIVNADGRLFVKKTKAEFDSVILAVGYPASAQINRFYTVEFFKEVRRILKDGGIFSFGLMSSESYMNKEQRDLLSSVCRSLNSVFEDVLVFPGETAYFLASNKKGILGEDYHVLLRRANARGLNLKFVREYYLFSRLSEVKIAELKKILNREEGVAKNHDFRPMAYFYNTLFLSSYFRDSIFKLSLSAISARGIIVFIVLLSASVVLVGFFLRKKKKIIPQSALLAVAAGGATQMFLQVIAILSFQSLYGYVFSKLGVIITFFMFGLASGSFFATTKKEESPRTAFNKLIKLQLGISFLCLIFPFIMDILNVVLLEVAFLSGFAGGMQFILAGKILLSSINNASLAGGIIYGFDLFGAFIGAFFSSLILIPVLGVANCLFLAAFFNFSIFLLLALIKPNPANLVGW